MTREQEIIKLANEIISITQQKQLCTDDSNMLQVFQQVYEVTEQKKGNTPKQLVLPNPLPDKLKKEVLIPAVKKLVEQYDQMLKEKVARLYLITTTNLIGVS